MKNADLKTDEYLLNLKQLFVKVSEDYKNLKVECDNLDDCISTLKVR